MLKQKLFFVYSICLFAGASLVLDIYNNNPYQSGLPVFVNFYLSLLIFLASLFSLIIYYLKIKMRQDRAIYSIFWSSVRQGTIISLGITSVFILLGFKILDWWIGVSIIIVNLLLELFFQTTKTRIKKRMDQNE